tara:strand:- start:2148 stop:2894 length:747 start_codon:yes stop_codon:yes gene_type:complete
LCYDSQRVFQISSRKGVLGRFLSLSSLKFESDRGFITKDSQKTHRRLAEDPQKTHRRLTEDSQKTRMNDLVHEGILEAAQKTILRPGGDSGTREWRSILREVHRAISIQNTTWRKGSLHETLQRLAGQNSTGLSLRFATQISVTSPVGWCFLSALETYLDDIFGELYRDSDQESPLEASKWRPSAIGNMNMRTFMEYMVFLIDETNFTTPLLIRSPNRDEANMAIFISTMEAMGDMDYPDMFNNERLS